MRKTFLSSNRFLIENFFLSALILFLLIGLSSVSAADNQLDDALGGSDIVTDEILVDDSFNTADYHILKSESEGDNSHILKSEAILDADSHILKSESVSKSNLGSSGEDEVIDNTKPGNFYDLEKEIRDCYGNEYNLTRDYVYDVHERAYVIKIAKDNFTIDGQGHTVDGDGWSSLFHIDGNNVTLKNINFINGHNPELPNLLKYGAVNINGTGCSVINCNFTNNGGDNGVALCFEESAHIEHCNFIGNKGWEHGGAVLLRDGGLIKNSNIKNNIAVRGAAIYSYGNLTLEDTHLENNTCRAKNSSEIFMANGTDLDLVQTPYYDYPNDFQALSKLVNECQGNVLNLEADFIYNKVSDGLCKNGVLIARDNFVIDGQGHAINALGLARIFNVAGQNVTLKNIDFKNGYSSNSGGAVYAQDVALENCNFDDNFALGHGGSVYIANTGKIDDCRFTNSEAGHHGGAVYAKDLFMSNSYLINNIARYGGSVLSQNADFDNCIFIGNSALNNGGAAVIENQASIKNSICCNNVATLLTGGAFHIGGAVRIENTYFGNNSAAKYGGAVNAKCGIVKGSTFASCNSGYAGGAVSLATGGLIDNCTLESNTAEIGGGLYSNGTTRVVNSTVANNTAIFYGGGIYFNGGSFGKLSSTINGTEFDGNYAGEEGGAIATGGNLTIDRTQFKNNSGLHYPAVYSLKGIDICYKFLEDIQFISNVGRAFPDGGATVI